VLHGEAAPVDVVHERDKVGVVELHLRLNLLGRAALDPLQPVAVVIRSGHPLCVVKMRAAPRDGHTKKGPILY